MVTEVTVVMIITVVAVVLMTLVVNVSREEQIWSDNQNNNKLTSLIDTVGPIKTAHLLFYE